MNIGGFQKNTFIDYPKKIAAIIFTRGCQFRCPYCHNPELVPFSEGSIIGESTILSFLNTRKSFLDGVVITGGEPCLQKDLEDFIKQLKLMGYLIKLDTNGAMPHVLNRLLLEKQVDYIAMDIKTVPDLYHESSFFKAVPDDIISSIDLIMEADIPYEFRSTLVKPFIDEEKLIAILKVIRGARRLALQQCNDVPMLNSTYFEQRDFMIRDKEAMHLYAVAQKYIEEVILR